MVEGLGLNSGLKIIVKRCEMEEKVGGVCPVHFLGLANIPSADCFRHTPPHPSLVFKKRSQKDILLTQLMTTTLQVLVNEDSDICDSKTMSLPLYFH